MSFAVQLKKERFKFNCAHFVAFEGFRERLHGHNYQVGVTLHGKKGADGYVVDFGDVKEHVIKICKQWNEHFICPTKSDVLTIECSDQDVSIVCQDGAKFLFPRQDCLCLPIVHSTAEELAEVFLDKLIESMTSEFLEARGIHSMQISIAEAPGQEAIFSRAVGTKHDSHPQQVSPPKPCLSCE